MVTNPPATAGDSRDSSLIPGSGTSCGGGNGNPLQYSCWGNPMNRGTQQATVHSVTESDTTQHAWIDSYYNKVAFNSYYSFLLTSSYQYSYMIIQLKSFVKFPYCNYIYTYICSSSLNQIVYYYYISPLAYFYFSWSLIIALFSHLLRVFVLPFSVCLYTSNDSVNTVQFNSINSTSFSNKNII